MKKGFTIIEIVLSILLIVVIGVVSALGITSFNKYNKEKSLKNMNNEILTALRLYIETNSQIKKNIYEDYEGMAITLKTLENEGLVDFTDLNITDDDYVVAMLSQESGCTDITTVSSWDLTNGPLSICLKSEAGDSDKTIKEKLLGEDNYYIAKGANPNNYVEFEVESDDSLLAYFPDNEDKNLWRIMSINNEGYIKLIYSQEALSNNQLLDFYSRTKEVTLNDKTYYCDYDASYDLICEGIETLTGWQISEVLSDITDEGTSKKDMLYEKIKNKSYIVPYEYIFNYYNYDKTYLVHGSALSQSPSFKKQEYTMGTLTSYDEYKDTIIMGDSWLILDNEKFGILDTGHVEGNKIHLYLSSLGVKIKYYNYFNYETSVKLNGDTYTTWVYLTEHLTYNYKPVIVLNKNVEIVKPNCDSNKKIGSKECPYKLECSDCD